MVLWPKYQIGWLRKTRPPANLATFLFIWNKVLKKIQSLSFSDKNVQSYFQWLLSSIKCWTEDNKYFCHYGGSPAPLRWQNSIIKDKMYISKQQEILSARLDHTNLVKNMQTILINFHLLVNLLIVRRREIFSSKTNYICIWNIVRTWTWT